LATLSWDKEADLDLHVIKVDRKLYHSEDTRAESQIDSANWMSPTGETLSLDVDNVYGFGPENLGEKDTVEVSNDYCYMVMVHYYSGVGDINARVDVTNSTLVDGKIKVDNFDAEKTLTSPSSEWWEVGVYPPDCKDAAKAQPEELDGNDHQVISGVYNDDDWGQMVVEYDGTTFRAAYDYREGYFTGSYDEESGKIVGDWCEKSGGSYGGSGKEGKAEFDFIQDETGTVSFDGRWNRGEGLPWYENWDLTKTANEEELADLRARLNADTNFCE
jgi:hypothetical protein